MDRGDRETLTKTEVINDEAQYTAWVNVRCRQSKHLATRYKERAINVFMLEKLSAAIYWTGVFIGLNKLSERFVPLCFFGSRWDHGFIFTPILYPLIKQEPIISHIQDAMYSVIYDVGRWAVPEFSVWRWRTRAAMPVVDLSTTQQVIKYFTSI